MIIELTVENIAVIEKTQMQFGAGFTVLTGETGAGKSLLIDAIDLAVGGRADTDLVRTGATKGTVSLVLNLSGLPKIEQLCLELGYSVEDHVLFILREVSLEGRSSCRIGGKMAPVGALRQLGQVLIDLHGQHEHQQLMDPEKHLEFLDCWIGEPAKELIVVVGSKYSELSAVLDELNKLKRGAREREQRIDLLKYQVQEIGASGLQIGELAELESAFKRLQHVEKLSESVQKALTLLSDGEAPLLDSLAAAVRDLEPAERIDESLVPTIEILRDGLFQVQEAVHALGGYANSLESDPNLLEETIERMDLIRKLVRKYGEDESQILHFYDVAMVELNSLENFEEATSKFELALVETKSELASACKKLTKLRQEKSKSFAQQVQSELREMAMEKAIFEVSITEKSPDANGADSMVFHFSANPGEEPKALNKIASGGEMSRVMLALKVAMAGKAGVPTLIFDEIDTGLSGRTAAVVAKKLKQISSHYQVIAISHLPQLAGVADVHHRITKLETKGRTHTEVQKLDADQRVEELARMLAGEEVGDSAVANARELLSRNR